MTQKPARAVLRPPGFPPSDDLDYADEAQGSVRVPVGDEDLISVAVGSPLYIERPGITWLPWAYRDEPTGRREIAFDRLYPKQRLLVDIYPSLENLDREARERAAAEMAEKRDLCAQHQYAYVTLHEGQPLDSRVFASAVAQIDASQAEPVSSMPDPQGPAEAGEPNDPLSTLLGVSTFHVRAGPELLPWAWRVINAQAEWARDPLVFDRYYWSIPMVVDFLPDRRLLGSDRPRVKAEVRLKTQLARENRVVYLPIWGTLLPSKDRLDRLLRLARGSRDAG